MDETGRQGHSSTAESGKGYSRFLTPLQFWALINAVLLFLILNYFCDIIPANYRLMEEKVSLVVGKAVVHARAEFTYTNRSGRNRILSLWYPIQVGDGQGCPRNIRLMQIHRGIATSVICTIHRKGIIAQVPMEPRDTTRVRLDFDQECSGPVYRFTAGSSRNWLWRVERGEVAISGTRVPRVIEPPFHEDYSGDSGKSFHLRREHFQDRGITLRF